MLELSDPVVLPTGGPLSLAPLQGIVSVAAFDGMAGQLRAALGVELPATPHTLTAAGVIWLWAGIETWLAVGGDYNVILTTARDFAAVVDQSHGRVILLLSGPHATAVLAKLAPIDLHPQAFTADATALTLAGHINVQIWRQPDGFALACLGSFAQALAEALTQASGEFEGSPHV